LLISEANNSTNATAENIQAWDRLAALSLVIALCIVLISAAHFGARTGWEWANPVFWLGIILILAPVCFRLLSQTPTRAERVGLLVLTGLALYAVKVLHSPIGFTFTDELSHWRTLLDIDQTRHLFQANSLLPVSPFYPALEILTHAFMSISGLTAYEAGVITVGVARVLFVLSLYGLFILISDSDRITSLTVLLFMGNSNFVFFNVQFSYASLGLPLAAFCLMLIVKRSTYSGKGARAFLLCILMSIAALLLTHHITSYVLAAFLIVWVAVVWFARLLRLLFFRNRTVVRKSPIVAFVETAESRGVSLPGTIALLIIVGSVAWLVTAASTTIRYLAIPLTTGIRDFLALLSGTGVSRQLFQDFTGLVAPLWERVSTFASIALIGIGLLLGLFPIWRQRRFQPLTLVLALIGASFPAVQLMRLNASAWEISNRLSEFIFLVVAFVIAIGIVTRLPKDGRSLLFGRVVFMSAVVIIIIGGLNSGWPFWARLPGPYLVAADTRSVEARSIDAARWAKAHLGIGNRIGADRINRLLLATYGEQNIVTNVSGQGNVAFVFMSPNFENAEKGFLQRAGINYLLVDQRLSTSLPVIGIYYEKGEPNTNNHKIALDLNALTKFDKDAQVNRIFDDGAILIYDVNHVTTAP